MKWFKHISDSLDNPFIFELIEKHGPLGYLVFFGVIEIYAREFNTDSGWKLKVSSKYLMSKLKVFWKKKLLSVLNSLKTSGKWEIVINNDDITIFIPKFRELLDESTIKKLREKEQSFRNHSGTLPKSEATDRDKEADVDKEKELKASVNYKGNDQNDGQFKQKTQEALNKVLFKFPRFPHARLLGNAFSLNKHPQAIIYALEETATKCNGLDPANYFETILKRTSGNFYEKEFQSKAKNDKNIFIGLVDKLKNMEP